MSALTAVDVCHGYGGAQVLKNFNIALQHGAFEALMGPSGSGKSTFLHLVCGLLSPDSGSIKIDGREITSMSGDAAAIFRRKHLGVVFQSFNLIDSLDVAENIVLPIKLNRQKPDMERLESLLERLELADKRKQKPAKLSGGERQRVAIARALFARPALILADEPTGNLDMESSAAFCRMLKKLNQEEQCAILMVTHDPVVAATADKVHFLRDGVVRGSLTAPDSAESVAKSYLEFCR